MAVGLSALAASASAADPTFVGRLALVVEGDVAARLELSPEVREQLQSLLDEREDAALELALEIKDLPASQRAARLAPFVAESERAALALLSDGQRAKLEQIRIARVGMATLTESGIQRALNLSAEQSAQIADLARRRSDAMTEGGDRDRRITAAEFERETAALLSREQRAAWERVAGLAAGGAATPGASSGATPGATPGAAPDGDVSAVATADTADDTAPLKTEESVPDAIPMIVDDPQPRVDDMPEVPDAPSVDVRPSGPVSLKFNFRFAPWQDVLDWFAGQADLSLVLDSPPPGTFNYIDSRSYTPEQAIDLLNSVLLTKGYTLVLRDRMLLLINLEDGIPPNLVSQVTPEDLDKRGEFELVSCLFQLETMTPDDAEKEIARLLGPQGSVVGLPKARQIFVTETAGKLRTIRAVIDAIENPPEPVETELRVITLKNTIPDEVLPVVRQLLGLPEEQNAAPDGSIRIAVDPLGSRLLVSGDGKHLDKLDEIVKLVDVPAGFDLEPGTIIETPQLEVYPTDVADPQSVLDIMRTLLAGLPDVRLATDPKSGHLVAMARPSQHATIRATLEQLQRDARQIEVIRLSYVDPQLAVLSINKLFGAGEDGDSNGPQVDADPTTGQLLIRGTTSQIEQIRTLLEKMGESETDSAGYGGADRGNVRMIPLSGSAARSVLERAELIWPTMRRNRIRTVTPSATIRTLHPRADSETGRDAGPGGDDVDAIPGLEGFPFLPLLLKTPHRDGPRIDRTVPPAVPATPRQEQPPPSEPPVPSEPLRPDEPLRPSEPPVPDEPPVPGEDRVPEPPADDVDDDEMVPQPPDSQTRRLRRVPAMLVGTGPIRLAQHPAPPAAVETPAEIPRAETPRAETPAEPEPEPEPESDSQANPDPNAPAAEIIVAPGPGGVMIASQDLDALDAFEQLLLDLADRSLTPASEYTVFYLKYAQAEVAADLLKTVLGIESSSGGGGRGGGGMLGNLAGAAMGDMGGGLLGSLLGLGGDGASGGGIATSGTVSIVPDPRLNALVVQGNQEDIDLVERLLEVIDQKSSPEEVRTIAQPKLIPVYYTTAEEIATVVRSVYANRISSGSSNQQRQPSPEEFIRALRGGGRGGGNSSRQSREQQEKMTIGVDSRSNSLVVTAPEPLFQEVEALVRQLDRAGSESDEVTQVITLRRTNPATVQQALRSIVGQQLKTTTPSSSRGASRTGGSSSSASRPGGASGNAGADQMRQRAEMMRAMQERMQQGGRSRGR